MLVLMLNIFEISEGKKYAVPYPGPNTTPFRIVASLTSFPGDETELGTNLNMSRNPHLLFFPLL